MSKKPTKSLVPDRDTKITGWYEHNGRSGYLCGNMKLASVSIPKVRNDFGVDMDAISSIAKTFVPKQGKIKNAASHNHGGIRIVRKPTHEGKRAHFGSGQNQSFTYPSQIVTPVNQANRESHVLVPLALGFAFSLPAFLAALFFVPGKWASGIAFLVYIVVVMWRLGVADSLLQSIEEYTHTDINKDGKIGDEPIPQEVTEVVWSVSPDQKTRQRVGVSPISPEMKDEMAQKLSQNGGKWSRREFVGHPGGHIVPHDAWVGNKYGADGKKIKGIDQFSQDAGWVQDGFLTQSGREYFGLPSPNDEN